jgi:hypothetical protein
MALLDFLDSLVLGDCDSLSGFSIVLVLVRWFVGDRSSRGPMEHGFLGEGFLRFFSVSGCLG